MGEQYAIEIENVEKYFKLYADKGDTAKEKLLFWKRNRYEKKHVLRGISFRIKKGEAVGLIGHNGCGKSTTLKILTRIMYPDTGTVEMNGRVSSLLELGAGFHPDMSGIENIYINASIFGLSKREIDERLNDIIEFAELGEYINNPVRTYSSGMYMRLAFAVAINVNADILLIDEILAVGDVKFQAKCFHKMLELKESGVTIVLVSHSTEQIESICDRSIWIHEGIVQADGAAKEVHRQYLDYMGEERREEQEENENKSKLDLLEENQRIVQKEWDAEKEADNFYLKSSKFNQTLSCKLYLDQGNGFCEENLYIFQAMQIGIGEYEVKLDLEIEEGVSQLRFHPTENSRCFVVVSEVMYGDQILDSHWTGKILEYNGVFLDNSDSYVIWNIPDSEKGKKVSGTFRFIIDNEYMINKMIEYLKK